MNNQVLVVDDDTSWREIYRILLEMLGYRVLTAATGEEGWMLSQKHGPEIRLAITDGRMPRGDGLWLAQRLRDRTFPLLLISFDADAFRQHAPVFDGILRKDIEFNDLEKMLLTFLNSHRRHVLPRDPGAGFLLPADSQGRIPCPSSFHGAPLPPHTH